MQVVCIVSVCLSVCCSARHLHATGSSSQHRAWSPDHSAARSTHNRSRSRSPLHRHPSLQALSTSSSSARDRDSHFSRPPSFLASDAATMTQRHAFTSLMTPSGAVGMAPSGVAPAAVTNLGHDARQLMAAEHDRLSALGAAFVPPSLNTGTDPLLRDRLLTEQRDRRMFATAADYTARPLRVSDPPARVLDPPFRMSDPPLRPELFASPADSLLGSVGSALLRPTLACPPGMKLPQPPYGPALASLNLPFR